MVLLLLIQRWFCGDFVSGGVGLLMVRVGNIGIWDAVVWPREALMVVGIHRSGRLWYCRGIAIFRSSCEGEDFCKHWKVDSYLGLQLGGQREWLVRVKVDIELIFSGMSFAIWLPFRQSAKLVNVCHNIEIDSSQLRQVCHPVLAQCFLTRCPCWCKDVSTNGISVGLTGRRLAWLEGMTLYMKWCNIYPCLIFKFWFLGTVQKVSYQNLLLVTVRNAGSNNQNKKIPLFRYNLDDIA